MSGGGPVAEPAREHSPWLDRWRPRVREVRVGPFVLSVACPADVDALLDAAEEEDALPFWAEIWPAGVALATYLLRLPLAGQRVLELGAGVGVVGIVAALLGARVTQTDLRPEAMAYAAHNARACRAPVERQIVGDWRSFPDVGTFPWVVAADVLYEPASHAALARTVAACLAPGGTALFADPGRVSAARFVDRMLAEGWEWDLVEQEIEWESGRHVVDVHRFRRPARRGRYEAGEPGCRGK